MSLWFVVQTVPRSICISWRAWLFLPFKQRISGAYTFSARVIGIEFTFGMAKE